MCCLVNELIVEVSTQVQVHSASGRSADVGLESLIVISESE